MIPAARFGQEFSIMGLILTERLSGIFLNGVDSVREFWSGILLSWFDSGTEILLNGFDPGREIQCYVLIQVFLP
jgi:hypothetical protein